MGVQLPVPAIPSVMASSTRIQFIPAPRITSLSRNSLTCFLTLSFWSYELCKRWMTFENETPHQTAMKILLCGGIAGIVTWGSVFPLDMIKTRLQAQTMQERSPLSTTAENQSLLRPSRTHLNSVQLAREVYRAEGVGAFYRGLGICSIRAFIVNAVQVGPFP